MAPEKARGGETPAAKVVIYTDGACRGNPGPGGWGAVLLFGPHEREIWGGEAATTNNRMELMAAIQALETLNRPCKVEVHTDSQYVQKGIHEWIHSWKRLDAARLRHQVDWRWVKGHAGHELNERADELAREGLKEARDRAA